MNDYLLNDTCFRKPTKSSYICDCGCGRFSGEESETDSWSDDSESEKLSRSSDAISDDSGGDPESLWPRKDRLGHLYMHYVENTAPYGRVPLITKVQS